MLERLEPVLKIFCAALVALLLYQVGRLAGHSDPLAHVTIPALPTLASDTNAPASGKATNSATAPAAAKSGTNTMLSGAQNPGKGTNAATTGTPRTETNSDLIRQAAWSGTNVASDQAPGKRETNSAAVPELGKKGTNIRPRPAMVAMGMSPFGGPAGMRPPELAPSILARVDRVNDSEILGPIIRPLPMGLLGIAGDVAFLRAPNGQTGLVKEGDELGGLKLLRICTNRVLVEQDGQPQELTIFSGFGGESLMTKPKENSP